MSYEFSLFNGSIIIMSYIRPRGNEANPREKGTKGGNYFYWLRMTQLREKKAIGGSGLDSPEMESLSLAVMSLMSMPLTQLPGSGGLSVSLSASACV